MRLLILLLFSIPASAQYTYIISADSTKFRRVGGNNELIIENATRATTGVLVNYGNGRTRFSKPRIVGDTLFVGVDTILGVGAAGIAWGLTGNAGTTPGTNFIGNTDAGVGLMFKAGGTQSGFIDITQDNTSFGFASLISNTALGSSNAAFGYRALTGNTDGYNNTAMGWFALAANTTNISNTAIGVNSQAASDAFGNTSVGAFSLRDNTSGYSNVAIGTNAGLVNTTGLQNTFVGAGSAEANTTGQENTMVGYDAGLNNTTGIRNVHVGWNAKSGTNGGNNVMIGYRAGVSLTAGNTTNVFIGSQSGDNASQKVDATNSIAIGQGTFTTANNQIILGNTSILETRLRGVIYFDGDAGTSGEVLTSNGTGSAPTWQAASGGGSPAGNFGNIQLNRNGAFDTPASDSIDFESATGLSVKGNINSTASFVGTTFIDPTSQGSVVFSTAGNSVTLAWLGAHFKAQNTQASIGAGSGIDRVTVFSTSTVVNDNAQDYDFRVEGQSSTHALFIDGSANAVGISKSTPTGKLHIGASATPAGESSIKIDEGSRQTTPEDGTINYVANNLEFTEGSTVYIIAKTLTATATLNFDLTAVNSQDLTITVTGAVSGDVVVLALDPASVAADITYFGWVSAANTVSVRCSRVGGGGSVDPASGSFRATVIRY